MKACFKCKVKKPMFLYHNDTMKYQLKSNKGKVVECRLCRVKRFIRQKGEVITYNINTKKFEIVRLKVN